MHGKAVWHQQGLYRGCKLLAVKVHCDLWPCSPKMQHQSACQSGYYHLAEPGFLSARMPLGHSLSSA